ncbi:MAG: hypothetical protein SGPRY_013335, partial [Prymnesium sp.]
LPKDASPAGVRAHSSRLLSSRDEHAYILVGGLQRSGTTWLEGLVASPLVSSLSFDNAAVEEYEKSSPWALQNHTREYFEMVAKFGGVEGKFVQNVYRYMYLVRDIGRDRKHFSELLPREEDASPSTASRLYGQWALFWDTSRPILLEKTPENLLMGPYLQATFGRSRTRFVFIMRHPLVWALAIEKWISPEFASLRTVEERVGFWFAAMSRAARQLPTLSHAVVLQLELLATSANLQLALSRHLLCSHPSLAAHLAKLPTPRAPGDSSSILAGSLAYVSCWLSGYEFKTSPRHCVRRKPIHDPAFGAHLSQLFTENSWRLKQMEDFDEVQANSFGYSFQPFVQLASLSQQGVRGVRVRTEASAREQAEQLGVSVRPLLLLPQLRSHLVVGSRGAEVGTSKHAPPAMHVLLAYHKMGFDSEKPTGMDIRMGQIVESLVMLRVRVHFVCHCVVDVSQLSPFGEGVIIYFGSLEQQYQQARAAAPFAHALLFFTTLTMFVHGRMAQGIPDWQLEPTQLLPEEQLLYWLRKDYRGGEMCPIAVTDDIHFLRSVEVMRRYDLAKALAASEWIRRRELSFYAAVTTVVTVSLEDSRTLNASFHVASPRDACHHCSCSLEWVPYVVDVSPETEMQPFDRRDDGILYVGGMHGLAVTAMEWLIQHVQLAIAASTSSKELLAGGKGHLYLAGPGWSQHVQESHVLNRSVELGHVSLLGILSDSQLFLRLRQHKVFAAPVINGTGIATKNVLAMARGIPLVTTPVGLNGLGLPPVQHAVLVADEPNSFAQKLLWVQRSREAFEQTWRSALAHASALLSPKRQQAVLCRILRCNSSTLKGETASKPELLCARKVETAMSPSLEIAEETFERANETLKHKSVPLVVIGLQSSHITTVTNKLNTHAGCIIQDPLRGLARAPMEVQLEHLTSILEEQAICQAMPSFQPCPQPSFASFDSHSTSHAFSSHELTQQRGKGPSLIHGFAIQLTRSGVAYKLLSTRAGVRHARVGCSAPSGEGLPEGGSGKAVYLDATLRLEAPRGRARLWRERHRPAHAGRTEQQS